MRRRLDLAASLIGQPRVLFLDEPTTGLDPRSRLVMWGIIRTLLAEDGVTVLLTTQYLEEADRLADRIAVIDHGRVTAEGTAAELKASVGGDHLEVAVSAGADEGRAMTVLARHACGPVRRAARPGRFEVPVGPRAGLVTDVVRNLDAEGIAVDDIVLRRPSLDDVFFALTSHQAVPGPRKPGRGRAEVTAEEGWAA
jgi:ABC-2 type transport system ATP-binding protein